jgi:hypothetical protein
MGLKGLMILAVSGDRAGRACLSETAGPRTQLFPVRPRTVARGKGLAKRNEVAGDPAASERRALPYASPRLAFLS